MFYFSKKVRLFSQNDVLFLFYFLINPTMTTGTPAHFKAMTWHYYWSIVSSHFLTGALKTQILVKDSIHSNIFSVLLERVFLRIGSAETDEQLETTLSKFLTPVLLKLSSQTDGVRKKVDFFSRVKKRKSESARSSNCLI